MIRRAILNVAVGGWYPRGQQRLFDSLQERGENATRLFWRDQLPTGCPPHDQAPYVFKPYAFQAAHALGFDQALWLDASVWMLRRLDPIWATIENDGCYLEPDGHVVGEWINELALDMLHLNRDQAMSIPLIEGKAIGLDFHDPAALEFLDEWTRLADAGAFNGPWTNDAGAASPDPRCRGHRHDISVASPLAIRFGLKLQPGKHVAFPADGNPGDRALMAQGM